MSTPSEPLNNCPIDGLLRIAGDRWSLLILRDAFYGVRRFDGFQKHLGISKKILTYRLRKLSRTGLLRRVQYREKPARFEYRLSAKGRDLFPVLLGMARWGNRWLATPGEEWLQLLHSGCGHITEPTMVCSECGERLTPASIQPQPGPSARMEDVRSLSRAVKKSSA